MKIVIILVMGSITRASFGFCPEHPSGEEATSVFVGVDKGSGCKCREIPGKYTFCFGRDTCRSFPRDVNITTDIFVLRASQIFELGPGDLVMVTHLGSLRIVENYNFSRILAGAFRDMSNLKNLSVSDNANLKVLEKGCFDGLVSLERLCLRKNAFVTLANVTAALATLPKLLKLELSENSFPYIKEHDFEPLHGSPLKELNLILCQIETIDSKAFNWLTNLTALRLGNNNFNASVITQVLKELIAHVPLKLLNLYSVGLRKNTAKQLLQTISNSNISSLCLASNQFEVINSDMFPHMPHLEVLDLSQVLALNVTNDAFVGLPNLKTLLLKGNKLASIPGGALLQQLTFLDLQQNSGDRFTSSYFSVYGEKFTTMRNLQQLNLSFNTIRVLYNSSFMGLGNLKVLGLKQATIFHIASETFRPLSKLLFLDLGNNPLVKHHPFALERLFDGLVELRVLLLGGCEVSFVTTDAFRNLAKLEHLGLERNHLVNLPSFGVLSNLKTIDLSENSLQAWQEPVFGENSHLSDVRLSGNKLTHLSEVMVQDLSNLTVLELKGNPFTCDCSLSWHNPKIMTLIEGQNISCSFPEATSSLTIEDFLRARTCQNWSLVISLTVVAFITGVILVNVFYFRWHLRYWLFLTRLHLSRNRKVRSNTAYTNYMYDAFVSYSSEDRNFVIRLVTMLENYPPFVKLCVYERDFEVGTIISENVLECVAKSRKTLLVVSDSYAKSQWCRWESQIAEHHRLFLQNENGEYVDDSLVLIKLGPINEAHVTPTLKYLLKTRIYLQWDEDEKKQKVFWQKLRAALAAPKEINENTYL